MARLATTTDVFNAIAEPQRREILNLLAVREWSVNDIAARLNVAQPRISKHLKVLRHVNLVAVRGNGAQRLYSASGAGLKPVHDWVRTFERHWNESFDRLDNYLRTMQEPEGHGKDRSSHGRKKQ
jgi:DNA-binding transcriptional ArsR family regulator